MPLLPKASDGLDLRLVPPALAAWIVAWQGRLVAPVVLFALAAVALTAAVALAATVGLLCVRRRGAALVLAAVLGCSAASATVTALHVGSRLAGPVAQAADRAAAVTAEAVLVDDPRKALGSGASRPGGGEEEGDGAGGDGAVRELVVVRVRVELLRTGGRAYRLRAPVVVLSDDLSWLSLLPSQRVRIEGRLRAPERGDDVAAVLSGRGPPVVLSGPSTAQRAAGHLRAGLRRAVDPLPDGEGGLLPGLVVGDTSRLDPALREDFRTVGLTHLTAVSGDSVSVKQ